MAYTNRNFTWDFDALKRFYEKYIVKWLNSAVSWTEAQKKQARANLGFGDGDAIVTTADNADSDLDVADDNGNMLMQLKDGHIKTKNFDSSKNSLSEVDVAKVATIEAGAQVNDVVTNNTESGDLDFSDEQDNVVMRLSNGHVKTKNFDSSAFTTIPASVQQNTEDIQILKGKINDAGDKLMKVVISMLEGDYEDMPFYIRTKYNNEKDIILTHRINRNRLLTFREAFIGSNSLEDTEIMNAEHSVSLHEDSTGAFGGSSAYYALFAQHGLYVPLINNTTGMTSDDVGSEWKDQLDRHFTIGKVTTSYVWLLPVIYKDSKGHDKRDWVASQVSADISSLTHVNGATHTSAITVGTMQKVQLAPVMRYSDRKWYADNMEITKPGTYYCDTFRVNESQIGYDPATVNDWFGGADGNPDLTGAEAMCELTYSYNYCGAQCCVNTTITMKRESDFIWYGGTQQQFFVDNGDYKAMIMLPKAAARNGVELDKPFNSPATNASYYIYRNSSGLKDVNNPVDRQIGFLYNPNTDDYLVGMAAGLSLVSGDTVTAKRIQNCAVGDSNYHRICTLSPQNTNKFYIVAINNSNFENNDYYYPVGYFKEINYYVSYFDPAENIGQVYWYKDGNSYIIYAHCQSQQSNLAINVPAFMEGLGLTVVEKTVDTQLLTDTIQNGKFFVNYNTADANYIVLKAA